MSNITFDKTTLHRLYIEEKLSINQIADKYELNPETIRRWLHRNQIQVRKRGGEKKIIVERDSLLKDYLVLKKPMAQIAKELGCGETAVWNLLRINGIDRRTKSEALKGRRFSINHRIKLSNAKIGKKVGPLNPNWKGGVAVSNTRIRYLRRYATFRRQILRMRGERCEMCNASLIEKCPTCGHRPDRHVHHVNHFSTHPKERLLPSNVTVICSACHFSIHRKKRP